MQSEVENLGGLARKLTVKIPQEKVQGQINKKVQELAKEANVKGFRKGKVPASVVRLQYGEAVKHEVIEEILKETLPQAFEDQNIYPASAPKITFVNVKDDAPLEYEAEFEVFPEVKINIEDISVDKPNVTVTDEHISDVIEKLRKQNVKWVEVDRPAKEDDQVVIDFEGFIDEAVFEGGNAKDFELELGKNRMIPGFEDPIIGAKQGDELEVNVTFPEDYHAKQYAGKPVKFEIKIHKVMEPELPELNDAFAADLGVSNGTLAGLQSEVRQNLERELERRIREQVKSQIIEKILEKNVIDVPQGAVEQEIQRLQEQMQKQFSMATENKNIKVPFAPEIFADQARKNVILGVLLSQWIKENEIKVDPDRVRDRVDQIASGYHRPHEIVNWYYGNENALAEIESSILEEQAIDKILETIDVVEKESSFEEIMNFGQEKGEE